MGYAATVTHHPLTPSLERTGIRGPAPLLAKEGDGGGYLIEEVLPRRTKLSRRAAGRKTAFEQVVIANLDVLVIVASVHEPTAINFFIYLFPESYLFFINPR